ncbi:hypothetical protein WJX84_006484 [Apatococcus fuscideae]|uniref:Uncharacterized protein n=1 Tax=Apatococcus fuscideae TaxID=2026836 RepID=A0AAW1TNN3_9CHLO
MDSSQLSSGPMQFRIHGVRTGQMVAKRAGELPDDSLTKGPSVTWAPAGQACTLSARSFRGREVIKLHRGASRSTTCAWLNQRTTVRSAELAFSPSGQLLVEAVVIEGCTGRADVWQLLHWQLDCPAPCAEHGMAPHPRLRLQAAAGYPLTAICLSRLPVYYKTAETHLKSKSSTSWSLCTTFCYRTWLQLD